MDYSRYNTYTQQLLNKPRRYDAAPENVPNVFTGKISREAMYWLGVVATDGSITRNSNTSKSRCSLSYRVTLSMTDHDLVYKFRDFMGGKGTITNIKKQKEHHKRALSYGATISTEDYMYLRWLGITPNKGLTLYINDRTIASDLDFLRGVIDGDGHFGEYGTKKKRTNLGLTTGSEDFAYLIAECLEGYIVGTPYIEVDDRPSRKHPVYKVTINTKRDTRTILHMLYEGAPEHIRIERKYQNAMYLLDKPEVLPSRRTPYRKDAQWLRDMAM